MKSKLKHLRILVLLVFYYPFTIQGANDNYLYAEIQYISKTTQIIKIGNKEYRYSSSTLMIEDPDSTTSTLTIDDFKIGDSIGIAFTQDFIPQLTTIIFLSL